MAAHISLGVPAADCRSPWARPATLRPPGLSAYPRQRWAGDRQPMRRFPRGVSSLDELAEFAGPCGSNWWFDFPI